MFSSEKTDLALKRQLKSYIREECTWEEVIQFTQDLFTLDSVHIKGAAQDRLIAIWRYLEGWHDCHFEHGKMVPKQPIEVVTSPTRQYCHICKCEIFKDRTARWTVDGKQVCSLCYDEQLWKKNQEKQQ